MTNSEKESIIRRAAEVGVDVSGLDTRALGIVKAIFDYVDGQLVNYSKLKEDIKSFGSQFTATAIAAGAGISRSNLSRNPVLRALVGAVKPDLETEIIISRNEYERLKSEVAMYKEWKDAELLRELRAAEMEKELRRVQLELENEKTCRANQSNMIRMLREENKILQERLKTHTIVIPAEGDNREQ